MKPHNVDEQTLLQVALSKLTYQFHSQLLILQTLQVLSLIQALGQYLLDLDLIQHLRLEEWSSLKWQHNRTLDTLKILIYNKVKYIFSNGN